MKPARSSHELAVLRDQIRALLATGHMHKEIVAQLGCHKMEITNVVSGRWDYHQRDDIAPTPPPVATGWVEKAACGSQPDDRKFFPANGRPGAATRLTCAGCPVREDCLQYAITTGQEFGVWGGLSEDELRTLRGVSAGQEVA